jgi:phosphoglucosamine mutase
MSNMGLELALKQLGIPFARAKVGDRYVLEKLQEKGWRIGAENSGHVILLDQTTTGDGIVASLQVVAAMARNHMRSVQRYENVPAGISECSLPEQHRQPAGA